MKRKKTKWLGRKKHQLFKGIKKAMRYAEQYMMPDAQKTPLTIEAFRKLHERCPLSQFLNYRYADDRFIYCADNPGHFDSVLMGFDITPLIIAGENAETALAALLKSLPCGATVLSMVQASSHVEPYMEAWAMARSESQDKRFEMTTRPRCKHIIDWAKHGLPNQTTSDFFKPRRLRYMIYVKVRCDVEGLDDITLSQYTHKVDQVHSIVRDALKRAGMGAKSLSGTEMIAAIRILTNQHLDPVALEAISVNITQPVNTQVIRPTTAMEVENDGVIRLFETAHPDQSAYLRCLSVTSYPKNPHYLQDMNACIGIVDHAGEYMPGDFFVYTLLECLDPKKVKREAAIALGFLEKQTAAKSEIMQSMLRKLYVRKEAVKRLHKLLERQGAAKVFTGMVISAPTKALLETYTEKAKQIWIQQGFDLFEESAIAIPMWLNALPGQYTSDHDSNISGLERGTTIPTKNAATLFHVSGDWVNQCPERGGLLLISRRGALTILNLYDSLTGYNGVVAAITGAGKSFFVADLANDFLSHSGVVRIIDAGKSYLNLATLVDGQNMVFKRGSGMCLNMCSNLHTKADLAENKTMIQEILSLMAFPQIADNDIVKDRRREQTEFLGTAITEVWIELKAKNRHLDMSVKDIADYCRKVGAQEQIKEISDLFGLLKKWAYGENAKWMVGQANVNFDNPFVVLELDDLMDNPELQAIVLNLVILRITQEMYMSSEKELRLYGKKRPKLLIIDESWKLLDNPVTHKFVSEAYRRARKYNACVWTIDQMFTNKSKNNGGTSVILSQSNFVVGLMQDKQPLLMAVKEGLIDLSDYEIDLINSLHKTHYYSEIFIKNKSTKATGLYRLSVDPVSYWTYTTKGDERAALDNMIRSGMSTQQAIERLAEQT